MIADCIVLYIAALNAVGCTLLPLTLLVGCLKEQVSLPHSSLN